MYPIFDWISYNTIDTKYTKVLGGNLLISPIWFLEKNATHTFLLKLGVHYGKLYLNWAIKYSWWWYSKAMTTSQLRKCRGPHENMLDVSCSSCDPTRLRVTELATSKLAREDIWHRSVMYFSYYCWYANNVFAKLRLWYVQSHKVREADMLHIDKSCK